MVDILRAVARLGDAEIVALGKALESNTTLTKMHLSRTCLAVVLRVSDCASVDADNQVSDAGAAVLARALESNTTLMTLWFGSAVLAV
jgi:hypothetical protein